MLKTLQRLRFTTKTLPVFLIWVSALAFGVMIPFLGLFADDWPFLYVHHIGGFKGVVNFIAWVRPFGAYLFALVTSLFGEQLWAYHIFLLIMRAVDAWLFYIILKLVWHKQTLPAVWAALLFVIFPSFKQQPLALEYAPHFITLGLLFFSLISMILAVQPGRKRPLWLILSILTAFNLFFIEYFAGLELLRPVLLWLILGQQGLRGRQRIRKMLHAWLPYVLVGLGFVIWRVFALGFVSFQPELLTASDMNIATRLSILVRTVLSDINRVAFGTWLQVFTLPSGKRALLIYGGLVGLAFITVAVYLLKFQAEPESEGEDQISPAWQTTWVGLGFFALLAAGWPFWITKIPVALTFPYDRSTLAFMPGACLLAVGLIGMLRSRVVQSLLLALLVSLSVGLHFQNANAFRKEWEVFKPFFWQLSWRVPALQPGTILGMDNQAFDYHSDKFYAPLINWTYAPENRGTEVSYYLFDFHKLDERYPLTDGKTVPVATQYGSLRFESKSDSILLIAYDPPGCLRVLSEADAYLLEIPDNLRAALDVSNLSLILMENETTSVPPTFLGSEPQHGWCYYYEKADLARQQADWQRVVDLMEEAQRLGLSPNHITEWLPLIDAYAQLDRLDRARDLSLPIAENDYFRNGICQAWTNLAMQTKQDDASIETIRQIQIELNCNQ